MKEYARNELPNKPYAYELTQIKVLDDKTPNTLHGSEEPSNEGVIHATKLLKDVEKTYGPGENKDESAKADRITSDGVRKEAVIHTTDFEWTLNIKIKVVKAEDIKGWDEKGIVNWMLKGLGRYYNKEKTLDWLSRREPHAHSYTNQELDDAEKVIKEFENPTKVASYRDSSLPARLDFNGIVEAKLLNFFVLASGDAKKFCPKIEIYYCLGAWSRRSVDNIDGRIYMEIMILKENV